jgi:hypothetical protein
MLGRNTLVVKPRITIPVQIRRSVTVSSRTYSPSIPGSNDDASNAIDGEDTCSCVKKKKPEGQKHKKSSDRFGRFILFGENQKVKKHENQLIESVDFVWRKRKEEKKKREKEQTILPAAPPRGRGRPAIVEPPHHPHFGTQPGP